MKETICTIVGLVGGFIAAIFGGWDSALVTLVIFMGIDFFTGVVTTSMRKSKHTDSREISSKAGWFLIRTCKESLQLSVNCSGCQNGYFAWYYLY